MLVETDGHTVPHFKAPVYAKMELWGPECGGTLSIQTSLLNVSHLLHKMSFVWFVLSTTVSICDQISFSVMAKLGGQSGQLPSLLLRILC